MRTPADQNKSHVLRKYLARRPNATALEAVRGIKAETGVDVSVALAAKVKRDMASAAPAAEIASAPAPKKRRRRRRKPVEAVVASTLTIESLLAAKKLVGQLGSVEAAMTAVDALAKLG